MLNIQSPLQGMRSPFGGRRAFNPASLFGKVSVNPVLAYATVKLFGGYSGPAMRILRPSDSAEMDVGFSGEKLDEPAIVAFLGAQIGQVVRWYDQSGNANHTAYQSTAAYRATIRHDFKHNGNLVPNMVGGTYELPAVSFDRRAASFFNAGRIRSGLHGLWRIGTTGDPYFLVTNGSTVSVSGLYAPLSVTVSEFILGASSVIRGFNEIQKTAAANSVGTETGGRIGAVDSGYFFLGDGSAFIAYQSELSVADRGHVKAALAYAYGAVMVDAPRLLFVGDSITVGANDQNLNGFNIRAVTQMANPSHMYQNAGGGHQLQTYVSGYAASLGKAILTSLASSRRIVFLHMGTNDLTIGGRTAAQIYADIQSFSGLVRADGAQCIVSTILPNAAWSAGQQVIRNDLNALIRAGWASFSDGFCDFAADPVMGPQSAASNSTLYPDGLHPSTLGHQNLAVLAAASIDGIIRP